MNEVYIDLRKYDLADRLGLDLIRTDDLLNRFEEALNEIDLLKEEIKDMKEEHEPDPYDKWKDSQYDRE